MGFDEENMEPKPRKHHKKKLDMDLKMQIENEMKSSQNSIDINKKVSTLKSYCVIFDKDKREICANTLEDLIKTIREKFKIDEMSSLRIEYWSVVYQDWILLESLPDSHSKIKVSLEETSLSYLHSNHEEVKLVLDYKVNNDQEQSNIFADNLNLAFKKYLQLEDKESDSYLNNFETAVIFIIKRREESQIQNLDEISLKLLAHEELIKNMNEEIKKLKTNDKQFKSQVDLLDDKLRQIELQKKDFSFDVKGKKQKKIFCALS